VPLSTILYQRGRNDADQAYVHKLVIRLNFRLLIRLLIPAVWSVVSMAFAQGSARQYTLILEDPPVASRFSSREAMITAEAGQYRSQIAAKQALVRQQLKAKHVSVIGSVSTVLNAVFVSATPDRVAELKTLSGVLGVVPAHHYHQQLNAATQLINAPAAWSALGGTSNAGAGIKIAILDTGIDQNNPAFQDSSLPEPSGFNPVCNPSNPPSTCNNPAFTNNKVIVARSYVGLLAAGSNPADPQLDSRPDDITPRDHEGHGTAVATCAAGVTGTVTPAVAEGGSGSVTIGGVAPKAYLGNYRVYGSPEVNDTTTDAAIIMALDDAIADGMDVINFSSGGPAISGALDTGAVCGYPAGVPCDPSAYAFEMAAEAGTIIVVAAGNDGPLFGTMDSPGDAPSVITPAAGTNSHYFTPTASAVNGPSNLQNLNTPANYEFVDNAIIGAATGPLTDVTTLGDTGLACSALPAFSLAGHIALIQRGTCTFEAKLFNAIAAEAIGVLIYDNGGTAGPFSVGNAGSFIQIVMISQSDGQAVKTWIDANPNQQVTINPVGAEQVDAADENELASFSSEGPNVGMLYVKPELTAPGEEPNAAYYGGILMGVEQYDILGELYSSTGFAAADGTSFSTPLTAGSAALVLQNALKANPGLTGPDKVALVRSALINNTAQTITTDDLDQGDGVDVFEIGSGLLNAGAAVVSNIVVNPATIAFNTLPSSQQFAITNNGASSVSLNIAVSPNLTWDTASSLTLTPSPASVTLAPGASKIVTITQSGTAPTLTAGSGPSTYTGLVTIQGSGVSLVVPYAYVVGDGVDAYCPSLVAFSGGFDGTVGQEIPQIQGGDPLFQIIDDYGVPIAGVPVSWTVSSSTTTNPTMGGGADAVTNTYGLAGMGDNCISCSTSVPVQLGSQPGTYSFTATTPLYNNCTGSAVANVFSGTARVPPALQASNPVLNAASFDTTVAAGSYVALFGAALSDPGNIDVPNDTTRLPLAIDYVNVSFDVPSAGISVPGHLTYVSPTQVNVQVPWELQGQTSAFVKVTIDYSPGNVVTVPIQAYAPGLFEWTPGVVAALANGTNAIVNQANPATRGTVVNIYANGLGPVNNQPASGESAPASGSPACNTKSAVTVKIGDDTVAPAFAGLAPGYPALYQITLTVPTDLAVGSQPVAVTVGGVTSKASAIWLQ
jgi:uncharacterized protein (TIGR03437 family)